MRIEFVLEKNTRRTKARLILEISKTHKNGAEKQRQDSTPSQEETNTDYNPKSHRQARPLTSMIVPVMGKDPRWLQVEVCREFQRGKCSRSEDECRFAHPPSHVAIHNGRVTACFDSLKGRCQREKCKYLHPPKHLKTQLETNGRMMQHQQQQMALQQPTFPLSQQMLSNPTLLPTWPLTVPTSNGTFIQQPVAFLPDPAALSGTSRRLDKSDKLEVCREYQRGACTRDESECRYAHPPRHASIDTSDGMVTVCMDFIKGKCQRESCKYFHPPLHLQGRVKAAQQQQLSAGASMSGVPEPYKKQSALELPLVLPGAFQQAFAQGLTAMQFTPTIMPTVPLLAGLGSGLPLLPTQPPQWQQLPPSCNYMPMETGTPPPPPPAPVQPAMSPPLMPSHPTHGQPLVQQELPPQPLYEPYPYQLISPHGQSIEMQYYDGVYYPVMQVLPNSPV